MLFFATPILRAAPAALLLAAPVDAATLKPATGADVAPRQVAAAAETDRPLTWRDLVNRPERWPARTKLTREQRFQNEQPLPAGTVVQIHAVKPTQAELLAPAGFVFVVTPADCDLLDAANRQWAQFTPEQRTLTLATLHRDKSLWPGRVTLTADQAYRTFTLKAGETHRVMQISRTDVSLWVPGREGQQLVPIAATDVLHRARQLAALPREERPGRVAEVLDGLLIDAEGTPVAIEPADIYVQYFSASTCPRCAIFTPKFIEHYQQVLAGRERVAFYGSSTDATLPPFLEHARATDTPWPILPHENKTVTSMLGRLGTIEIPGIVVFDKHGEVLLTTTRLGSNPLAAAERALTQLDDVLPPARVAQAE